MADFYNLDEAARELGMSPEELKQKAQNREVRAFLDGGSWRFRRADIDELARRRGLGSDPELSMPDADQTMGSGDSGINLADFQLDVTDADLGPRAPGLTGSDSDHDLLLDDLKLPQAPGVNSSSVIIGMPPGGKLPSDSDVRLVPDNPKGASDSDVRLAPEFPRHPSDSDVTLVAEDTLEHDLPGAALGSDSGSGDALSRKPGSGSGSGTGSRSGSSDDLVVASTDVHDSDFELTPSGVIDALQPDSGSDFELSALDPSDEFESTPLRGPSDSDVTAAEPGASGINLGRPSDSGINLLGSGFDVGSSSIELSPLSGSEIKTSPGSSSVSATRRTPSPEQAAPRKAEKDIFDDTDFEVDALGDAGDDRTVQLEAASDFELEEAESGSEVFAIDEDDVDVNAATAMSPGILEDEDDGFDDSPSSGEMSGSAWDVESEASSISERSAAAPMLAPSAATAEWGGLWVGMLGVATVFMLLLMFVSLDLVRNLYDFRGPTPASGIVKSIAGLMGG